MKKINYYLGALALASLGLASCSSDDLAGPDGPEQGRTDIDRNVYVNIAIHGDSPTGSRAAGDAGSPDATDSDDFQAGVGDESTVNSIYLVFYDDNGNVVGDVVALQPDFKTETTTNSVESVQKDVVKISLPAGQNNPTKVMCYINPVNQTELKNPLSTLQTLERAAAYNETEKTFPMSNSVYYLNDAATSPETAVSVAGKVYNTAEEASAEGAQAVDIYVERYAVKLTMNEVTAANIAPFVTATLPDAVAGTEAPIEVTLNFAVTGWGLNGEANSTYAIKSFREDATDGTILPNNFSFTALDNVINGATIGDKENTGASIIGTSDAWTWNAPGYHRSYWACSPVYFQTSYPEVGSDYDPKNTDINQTFISYNDIIAASRPFGEAQYFMETTSGLRALRSANPNAAVPSVLLVGEYTIDVNGTKLDGAQTFYTYVPVNVTVDGTTVSHPSVYFSVDETLEANKSTAASAAGEGTMSMHKRFLRQVTVLYTQTTTGEGTNLKTVYNRYDVDNVAQLSTLVGMTKIARPDDAVLALAAETTEAPAVKMADRTMTLQLTDAAIGTFINNNGKPMEIVATVEDANSQVSLDQANLILWQNVGTCNKYDAGKAFYNIPVKHLGWYRKGNTQKDEKGEIDFNLLRVGDLGMVRNHTYTISVGKIIGLADGVGGVDKPIIPPVDTEDVFVSYRVNILKWAVVPEQEVEL